MRTIAARPVTYLTIFLLGIASVGCTSTTREPVKVLPEPRHGGVYVVAHRGAHIGIPENTLAAYEAAIEMGVDFVEVDLCTTQDGQIVSIHNKEIDSYVTNGWHGMAWSRI